LSFVTISCDEPEQALAAASFIDKQGAPAPHYIKRAKNDDQFINELDPKWNGALPALFLFDRSGDKVRSFIGEMDMMQLKSSIENVLSK
jgi:glutathione peroxidase-family protein